MIDASRDCKLGNCLITQESYSRLVSFLSVDHQYLFFGVKPSFGGRSERIRVPDEFLCVLVLDFLSVNVSVSVESAETAGGSVSHISSQRRQGILLRNWLHVSMVLPR